jgi:hypothetical protein
MQAKDSLLRSWVSAEGMPFGGFCFFLLTLYLDSGCDLRRMV